MTMPPVHSGVLSSIVNMLLPAVHSAVTSPLLPSSCRCYCPCLLLCFLYHGPFSGLLLLFPVQSLTSDPPLIRFKNPLLWCCRSFSRSVSVPLLTSLLVSVLVVVDRTVGASPLTRSSCCSRACWCRCRSVFQFQFSCRFRNPADSHVLIL
jgi:hypothetical protein